MFRARQPDGFSEAAFLLFHAISILPLFWIAGVFDGPLAMQAALPRSIGATSFLVASSVFCGLLACRFGFGDLLGARRLIAIVDGTDHAGSTRGDKHSTD